ncbi:MAG: DUF2948 family protein [Rhizobiales bacterium]|nr:DUF2948 family protein [Hyphomicrobiales bacterium]
MDLLKLTALDDDDLSVLSAHLQDAVLRIGDIRYLPGEQRFVMVANRFDWQGATGNKAMRRRCGVHFDRVRAVQSKKVRLGADDAILSLLAIEFKAGREAPEGSIELTLSGGGSIRLDVECIEANLEDLGPMWETGNIPSHDD